MSRQVAPHRLPTPDTQGPLDQSDKPIWVMRLPAGHSSDRLALLTASALTETSPQISVDAVDALTSSVTANEYFNVPVVPVAPGSEWYTATKYRPFCSSPPLRRMRCTPCMVVVPSQAA